MFITSENYPQIYDKIYRVGFVIQILGILGIFAEVLAALIKGKTPVAGMPPATILFVAGTLLSAWFLLVWDLRVKIFIVISTLIGTLMMIDTLFVLNGGGSPYLAALGFGLVAAGAAGMAGKEAYCFKFIEGWILLGFYPLLTILIPFNNSPTGQLIFVIAVGIWLLLHTSFTVRKLRKPLMECQAGALVE